MKRTVSLLAIALLAIALLAVTLLAAPALAQDTLRLPDLQRAAVQRDPRLQQLEIQRARTSLRLRDLAASRLPQLTISGDGSYQSEVAALPIALPGGSVPRPPSTRIDAALVTDLLLYDGGAVQAQRAAELAQLETTRAELAATLHPVRTEVSNAYFDALLLQERLHETAVLLQDLNARLDLVRSQWQAGAALAGDTAALRVEVLRAQQQRDELASRRHTALAVLGQLTGRAITDGTVLALPPIDDEDRLLPDSATSGPRRPPLPRLHPQYAVFDAEREALRRQAGVVDAAARPQASAFGQLAYGRPGLQQFTDQLHEYWMAGVRVRWRPWDWGANRRQHELLRLQQQLLASREAAFTERLQRQVEAPLQSMDRLRDALATDEQIVVLREQIVEQARAQFEERATTAAAYVHAVTDLEAARVARVAHRVELARARADYLTTLGMELR